MWSLLKEVINYAEGWTEIRYHNKIINHIAIRKGELESSSSIQKKGIGIRVLINGTFGFSSTSKIDKESIIKAIKEATIAAKTASIKKKNKIEGLQKIALAKGDFCPEINDHVTNHSLEEKLSLVRNIEEKIRKFSPKIISAACRYIEHLDEKYIITTDGAMAHIIDSKPQFVVASVAMKDGETQMGYEVISVTGGWQDLFKKKNPEEMAEKVAKISVDLLSATYPEGGKAWVILDPSVVGLLTHEAIGHTVEADFVLAGSICRDKIGKKVASELITLVDSGLSEIKPNARGTIFVDDEGVPTQKTIIIENGVLKSYLHNRETAKIFDVEPTGNARAWSYTDEPIIRMRNTYIEPGKSTLDELISEIKEGYLLKGGGGGQADANAEFMFIVREAYRIKNGKVGELLRGVSISGQAFDVLTSCNGITSDFEWEGGTCGKGQSIEVGDGGPYLRCQVIIGGKQK